MRYKLTLEYDGSPYAGWQKQKNAVTVQGTLIDAIVASLAEAGGHYGDLQGSGRTDAGVHALAQVAHLEASCQLSPQTLCDLINQHLPGSIHLLSLEEADPRFHARHWARSRQYLYRISKRRNVFEKKYLYWVKTPINVQLMQEAMLPLLGMHDFSAFSSKPAKEKSPQLLLESVDFSEDSDWILIRIRASHFLWNMVRNLVGALIEVGKGEESPSLLLETLQQKERPLTQWRAPAQALFLEKVLY